MGFGGRQQDHDSREMSFQLIESDLHHSIVFRQPDCPISLWKLLSSFTSLIHMSIARILLWQCISIGRQ